LDEADTISISIIMQMAVAEEMIRKMTRIISGDCCSTLPII
jgi:hypothetical protein